MAFCTLSGKRGETEGGYEDLGGYPLGRNPLIPWGLDRHSWDHTGEIDGGRGEVE